MFLKVMRGGVRSNWRKDEVPRFEHVVVSALKDAAGRESGCRVEVIYNPPIPSIVIELPRDGDTVYLENEEGHTIDSVRWPPRPRKKEFRHGSVQTEGRVQAHRAQGRGSHTAQGG